MSEEVENDGAQQEDTFATFFQRICQEQDVSMLALADALRVRPMRVNRWAYGKPPKRSHALAVTQWLPGEEAEAWAQRIAAASDEDLPKLGIRPG